MDPVQPQDQLPGSPPKTPRGDDSDLPDSDVEQTPTCSSRRLPLPTPFRRPAEAYSHTPPHPSTGRPKARRRSNDSGGSDIGEASPPQFTILMAIRILQNLLSTMSEIGSQIPIEAKDQLQLLAQQA